MESACSLNSKLGFWLALSSASVVVTTRGVRTINPGSPFDHIEVDLQNALLAQYEFGHRHQCGLCALAEDRAGCSEKQVLYKLLRNGGGSAPATAFQIFVGSYFDLVPIEPVVLIEAPVFRGDDRVLEIGRDLTEGNKFVALTIRRLVNQGLQATLDVHSGSQWIDPPGSQKEHRGEQPEKRHTDDEPWNKRSEQTLPKRAPGVCLGFTHFSES
jgi:hypothetical protein